MPKALKYYVFAGMRFWPDRSVLEVVERGRELSLSQIQRNFLLTLVEKPKRVVTYEELRVKVWPHEPEMTRRVQHTIHVTKGHLIRLLEGGGVRGELIESVSGQGYRLAAEVSLVDEEEKTEDESSARPDSILNTSPLAANKPEQLTHQKPPSILNRLLGHHATFIKVSSSLYGLLFLIALLIEIAYQFDSYGLLTVWLGFPIMFINTVAVAAAMILARRRLRVGKSGGLFLGLGILVAAVFGSYMLALLWLPNAPITLTTFQAQPAIAAFLKNAVIYFLPLGFFFLLMPFYFVTASELNAHGVIISLPFDAIFMRPHYLISICLVAVVYSLVSTFFLLDNIQSGVYHGLFVSMVFIRFIVFFGLGLGCLLWYKTALNNIPALRNSNLTESNVIRDPS